MTVHRLAAQAARTVNAGAQKAPSWPNDHVSGGCLRPRERPHVGREDAAASSAPSRSASPATLRMNVFTFTDARHGPVIAGFQKYCPNVKVSYAVQTPSPTYQSVAADAEAARQTRPTSTRPTTSLTPTLEVDGLMQPSTRTSTPEPLPRELLAQGIRSRPTYRRRGGADVIRAASSSSSRSRQTPLSSCQREGARRLAFTFIRTHDLVTASANDR